MTLVEFINPVKKAKQSILLLAVIFFAKEYEGKANLTVAEIKSRLKTAKVPNASKMNVNGILNASAPNVHAPTGRENGRLAFELTETGEKYIRGILKIPAISPQLLTEVTTLNSIATKISDETIREFIQESITCLSVGALRAAIVFLWSGAMGTLHEQAMTYDLRALNAAIKKQDAKAREIKKIDDLQFIKDKIFLDAIQDLGIVDKSQKGILIEALGLRNKCGHPVKYAPKINKAKSFVEDITSIVFV